MLFRFFNVFLAAPWLAFVVAGFFVAVFVTSRLAPRADTVTRFSGAWALGVSLPWIAYGMWEMRMQAWSRNVTAPIRVDMACIATVLFGLGVLGLGAVVVVVWRLFR